MEILQISITIIIFNLILPLKNFNFIMMMSKLLAFIKIDNEYAKILLIKHHLCFQIFLKINQLIIIAFLFDFSLL